MVVLEKLYDVLAHAVIARLADERGFDTRAAEGDDAIEHAATGHRANGLLVLKNDIEHRLAYSENFSHRVYVGCCELGNKVTKKK